MERWEGAKPVNVVLISLIKCADQLTAQPYRLGLLSWFKMGEMILLQMMQTITLPAQ